MSRLPHVVSVNTEYQSTKNFAKPATPPVFFTAQICKVDSRKDSKLVLHCTQHDVERNQTLAVDMTVFWRA